LATLKIQSAEIEPFWATPEILLFELQALTLGRVKKITLYIYDLPHHEGWDNLLGS